VRRVPARPDGNGSSNLEVVDRDFAQMAASGLNAVRIPHTVPPRSLLDVAHRRALRVMVGLSAEQYVSCLIDGTNAREIEQWLRVKARECSRRPALLWYALGNEITAGASRSRPDYVDELRSGRDRILTYLDRPGLGRQGDTRGDDREMRPTRDAVARVRGGLRRHAHSRPRRLRPGRMRAFAKAEAAQNL
jgi:hypothetical protein